MQGQIYLIESRTRRRGMHWYSMHVQVDLFGGADLVCRWGCLGRAGCRQKHQRFDNESQAQEAMEDLLARHLQGGYRHAAPRLVHHERLRL